MTSRPVPLCTDCADFRLPSDEEHIGHQAICQTDIPRLMLLLQCAAAVHLWNVRYW